MLIGNKKTRDYFSGAIAQGTLAQTYCLVGPAGVGKRFLANELAAQLLKTTVEKLEQHPDFYMVTQASDEKTGKLKKDITIEQARVLKAQLQSRSWIGGHQVVIIDGVEMLNQESGNALLKFLEEPPAQCIVLLLTENDELLLPTIRSRAQFVYLGAVPETEIKEALRERGVASDLLEEVAKYAQGRPGVALTLATDTEALEQYRAERQRWQALVGAPFYKKISLLEDLFGDKEDAVRGRARLVVAIDIWIQAWREYMLAHMHEAHRIKYIIDTLLATQQLLDKNIHPRLALEQAVMRF